MYERPILKKILSRLNEPKVQILMGARQIGKTTLIQQALKKINTPHHYVIAESGYSVSWIEQQWSFARSLAISAPTVLVIDEIQKIKDWSERVKRLFDEDINAKRSLHVILLGSSSLLLGKGLTESMAGRFEIIPIPHWSFQECQDAFDLTIDEFLYFGGYPGALHYKDDEERFLRYVQDAIIEPVISCDIVSQYPIQKPALLRELFRLGSEYSSQILSFNKILGQLQDAGNTTTLAHYLTLLDQTFVLKGLFKFTNEPIRRKQSSPKFQVYNTALQSAASRLSFNEVTHNPDLKGRIVESAVGAYLLSYPHMRVYYWRENNKEVDFIVQHHNKIIAIEVKSGTKLKPAPGLEEFSQKYPTHAKLLVGTGGIPLETLLRTPLEHFFI